MERLKPCPFCGKPVCMKYSSRNGVHGRWECNYDDSTGCTDVTCSYCKNTRTVTGCFITIDGEPCYFEDDYCPNCGAKMDGGVSECD